MRVKDIAMLPGTASIREIGTQVIIASALGLSIMGPRAVAEERTTSGAELGQPVSIVNENPYASWQSIATETEARRTVTHKNSRAWTLQAKRPRQTQASFADPTLDSMYRFVQAFPVKLEGLGGASIPGIVQAEW
ncbi:MAG: hypothetical protein AAFY57_12480 [Cyanobacteria bacterium J06642_2]